MLHLGARLSNACLPSHSHLLHPLRPCFRAGCKNPAALASSSPARSITCTACRHAVRIRPCQALQQLCDLELVFQTEANYEMLIVHAGMLQATLAWYRIAIGSLFVLVLSSPQLYSQQRARRPAFRHVM